MYDDDNNGDGGDNGDDGDDGDDDYTVFGTIRIKIKII